MKDEPEDLEPYRSTTPVSHATPGWALSFSGAAAARGIVGAAIGGAVGFFVYKWLLSQGLYALAIPGATLGLGFNLAARRSHIIYGAICAALALGFGLFSEWATDVTEKSFFEFLTNISQLGTIAWIMVVVGAVVAFSCGRGRA